MYYRNTAYLRYTNLETSAPLKKHLSKLEHMYLMINDSLLFLARKFYFLPIMQPNKMFVQSVSEQSCFFIYLDVHFHPLQLARVEAKLCFHCNRSEGFAWKWPETASPASWTVISVHLSVIAVALRRKKLTKGLKIVFDHTPYLFSIERTVKNVPELSYAQAFLLQQIYFNDFFFLLQSVRCYRRQKIKKFKKYGSD